MKRFSPLAVISFVCLSAILFASPAAAAETKFWFYDTVTLQTPKDWTVDKTKQAVSFFNADKSTSLTIQILEPFTQATSQEFAESIRAKANGTELKETGDGLFSFTVEKDGVLWRNIAGVIKTSGIFIYVKGNDPNLEPTLKSMKLKLTYSPNTTSMF